MSTRDLKKPLNREENDANCDVNTRAFFNKESRIMLSMAWPMMVSFFCRMAMASVDSAFVGHITDNKHSAKDYLAAAGLSDMVTGILVIPPLAFNQSLNALVSQAMGSGNKKMAGTWLQLSLFWLTITYLPCLISFFYVDSMLALLGFSDTLCNLAGRYAKYNVFWPIPNGWYQCLRFYFQAQGITRPAMYNNLIFLGVNIILNWVFVFGGPFRSLLGWEGLGFVGAAVSLSVSRSLQPLAYWLYMFVWKGMHVETWPGWGFAFLERIRVKAFMDQTLPQVGTLLLQAVIGQTTTLLIAQLGATAIAASAAAIGVTQVFTGGLCATLCAVCGIRVGFHLGEGSGFNAKSAAWIVFLISASSLVLIAVVLLPLRHQAISVMTNDEEVQALAVRLIAPSLLNTLAGLIVECNTGGVLTSQGRTLLATILSFGVELPLSIGSVAFLVMWLHTSLVPVYWAQACVGIFEMLIVMAIFFCSDWPRYAREAKERQEVKPPVRVPSEKIQSPVGILQRASSIASLGVSPTAATSPTLVRESSVRFQCLMTSELAASSPTVEEACAQANEQPSFSLVFEGADHV